MAYLIALHLIAVTCWFAALFYLPRLFVYHAMTASQDVSAQFKIMEHKLYYYIMMPAMIITLISGFCLMFFYLLPMHQPLGWFWAKLILVAFLLLFHFACGHYLKAFKADRNLHPHRFYRIFNEVPTLLLIVIMLLIFVRP